MNAVEKHRGDEEIGNGADDGALLARGLEGSVRGGRVHPAADTASGRPSIMRSARSCSPSRRRRRTTPSSRGHCRNSSRKSDVCSRPRKSRSIWREIENERLQRALEEMDVYDPELDDLSASAAEGRRFEFVKELLTASALGTS